MGSYDRREAAREALVDHLDDLFLDMAGHFDLYKRNYERRQHAIRKFVAWFHDTYLGDIDFPDWGMEVEG
jgi:hypothetical protein